MSRPVAAASSRALLLVGAVVLVLAGCGLPEPGPVAESPGAEEETAEPGGQADSSPQDPIPPQTVFSVGDWELSLAATRRQAHEYANVEPIEGREVLVVEIAGAYRGADMGDLWSDLEYRYLGADGQVYGSLAEFGDEEAETDCGVGVPNDLIMEKPYVAPGETLTRNFCISLPEEAVDGGAWAISPLAAPVEDSVFVAVE